MRVTIKKIAEVAGVSRGTVDRALNNRSGIKPEVSTKVRRIAQELGYKPNLAAKVLSERQYMKKTIGILLITGKNSFFDEVMHGIEAALDEFSEFGIDNIVRTMDNYDVQLQLQLIDELVDSGVNGIVLTPINCIELSKKINELNAKGIKIVTINSDALDTDRMAYVGCRHKKSGMVLAGLMGLITDGAPTRIGIVTGTRKNLAVLRRLQGLVDTLNKDFSNIEVVTICENEDSDDLSYELTRKLLSEYCNLTGVCFLGAGIIGGIRAIKEMNLEKTLKITTYDLIDEVKIALREGVIDATITQEPYKQGYEGVQILGKYLAFGQLPLKELNYTELAVVTKYCLEDE